MAVGNLPEGTQRNDYATFPHTSFKRFKIGFTGRDPDLWDEEAMLQTAEEIAGCPIGQIQPAFVERDGDGFLIRAGSRRFRAIRYINKNLAAYKARHPHLDGPLPFKAIIAGRNQKLSEEDLVAISIAENFGRQDLTPGDRAYSARYMRDLGWPHAKIAERLHLSESAVSKILAATDVEPEVQELVRDGAVSEAAARQIRKRPREEQKRLAEKIRKSPEPRREAKRQVRAAKERVRAEGKQAGRTIAEVRMELAALGSKRSEDFLKWMGGNPQAPSLAALMGDGPYRGEAVGS
jgi:ParB-like chromosome segregation protein Spo0J